MSRYAEKTEVPVQKTRQEIETLLTKQGADSIMVGFNVDVGIVGFRLDGRHVKFVLPLPRITDPDIANHASGKRADAQAQNALEQAMRSRWRALLFSIKARFAAIDAGIEIFDSAFLGQIVMPDGRTIGEREIPRIAIAYETGKVPPLLPYHGPN